MASKVNHTAFSVPFVQSPISLLSVAPTVEPVSEVVQFKSGFTASDVAFAQSSLDKGASVN